VEEEEAASAAPVVFQSPDDNLPQVNLPPQLASAAVLSTLLVPPATATMVTKKEAPARLPFSMTPAQLVRIGLSILLVAIAIIAIKVPISTEPLTITPAVQSFYDQAIVWRLIPRF